MFINTLIIFFREVYGLSQEQVAAALKMDIKYYKAYELGYYLITRRQSQCLGKLFKVSPDFLYEDERTIKRSEMTDQEFRVIMARNRMAKVIIWLQKQYFERSQLSEVIDKANNTLQRYSYFFSCFPENNNCTAF